jgi:hypothetical protein
MLGYMKVKLLSITSEDAWDTGGIAPQFLYLATDGGGWSTFANKLCPHLNANVVKGCKRMNISSGIVNYTRTEGQQ